MTNASWVKCWSKLMNYLQTLLQEKYNKRDIKQNLPWSQFWRKSVALLQRLNQDASEKPYFDYAVSSRFKLHMIILLNFWVAHTYGSRNNSVHLFMDPYKNKFHSEFPDREFVNASGEQLTNLIACDVKVTISRVFFCTIRLYDALISRYKSVAQQAV